MAKSNREAHTKVLIYSSQALLRSAWKTLISEQAFIEVVGEASDLDGVQERDAEGTPHTLFIDDTNLDTSLVQQLHAQLPDIGLLVLGDDYPLEEIVEWMQAGVIGFISRNAPVAELARAIIATGRGELWLAPKIASKALATLAGGQTSRQDGFIEPLSSREAEVLELLARGMANKDIAQTLILSVRTVEAHLRRIYTKLRVNSRTEAVLWAVKNGYVEEG